MCTVGPAELDLPVVGREAHEADPGNVAAAREDFLGHNLVETLVGGGGQPVVPALRTPQAPAVLLRLEERERLSCVHLHVFVARASAEHPFAVVADGSPTCNNAQLAE